jgi:hypothetical protein
MKFNNSSITADTDLPRSLGIWGNWPQWLSATAIMNLKKSQLCIEFPFIWLSNLKFIEHRKSNSSHVRHSFCCFFNHPLHYSLCCSVWPHHLPHSNSVTVSDNISLALCFMHNGMSVRAPTVLPVGMIENLCCLWKWPLKICIVGALLFSRAVFRPIMKLLVIPFSHNQYVTMACR